MNLAQLVGAVLLKATGKVRTLSATDPKYQKIVGIANLYISQWSKEPGVDWASLYDPHVNIGTVTATDSYPLLATIRKVSNSADDTVILRQGDAEEYYQVVSADRLRSAPDNSCAVIKRSLVFKKPFTADSSMFGADILVPAYEHAPTMSAPSDEVPVDIPDWLVLMTAAEYIRNDISKQNQYGNLVGEANEYMKRMKDDNEGQVYSVSMPWSAPGGE